MNHFVVDLLEVPSSGLRHAICALISVVASTGKGVEYLTQAGLHIVEKVVKILKGEAPTAEEEATQSTDGSVT
jgi:hypothetical protein